MLHSDNLHVQTLEDFDHVESGRDTAQFADSCRISPSGRRYSLPDDFSGQSRIPLAHLRDGELADSTILEEFIRNNKFHVETQRQDLQKCTRLGSGSISKVFKTQIRGQDVAAKLLRVESVLSEPPEEWPTFSQDFVGELRVVRKGLHHPNITQFVGTGVAPYGGKMVPTILYEFMEGGCVESVLDSKSQELGKAWVPSRALSLSWSRQLLSALAFLHGSDAPIAHRDIKPANLLLSQDHKTLKLADFSAATEIHVSAGDASSQPAIAGSFRFMAPEVFGQEAAYSLAKADVYSAAVTCWCLIFGERPYAFVESHCTLMCIVRQGVRPVVPTKDGKLSALLHSAWDGNPLVRPTAEAMLQAVEKLEKRAEEKQAGIGGKIMRVLRKSGSFSSLPGLRSNRSRSMVSLLDLELEADDSAST
eukprot:1444918-Rhodomonas_salina.1